MGKKQPNNAGTLVTPTEDGITDGMEAIATAMNKGQWVMIAPDGRLWMKKDPMILFAALAAIMRGEDLKFGGH